MVLWYSGGVDVLRFEGVVCLTLYACIVCMCISIEHASAFVSICMTTMKCLIVHVCVQYVCVRETWGVCCWVLWRPVKGRPPVLPKPRLALD